MHRNPFSPSFSIYPDMFFGRKDHLRKFERALDTPGSADRFFFLTGTTGCGKTSLLHQYALLAEKRHWEVIEATSADALYQLLHYTGLDRTTSTERAIAPEIKAGGAAISLGSATSSKVVRESPRLLTRELCRKVRSQKVEQGLAIVIDEAQKIRRDDIVMIGNAVQQARSEGLEVALVLGGLPNAYSKIRAYRDCTFLRRMRREELWCMKKSETLDFLAAMFARIPEISIGEEQIAAIGQFCGGHPYLLQLVGDEVYKAVHRTYAPDAGMVIAVSDTLIEEAQGKALVPYKENVLDDVLTGSHRSTHEYIRAAFDTRDTSGLISVSDVNARIGDTPANMNSRRAYALNTQVLRKAGRGHLRFALPHFEYYFSQPDDDAEEDPDDEWEF